MFSIIDTNNKLSRGTKMFLTILAIIIIIISIVTCIVDGWYEIDLLAGGILATGLVWLCLSLIIGGTMPKTMTYENIDIVALKDNSSISGSFFLGTGTVDGEMKYAYYLKDGNGFKLESIDSDDVKIVYGNHPHIKKESGCKSSWEWITPCIYNGDVVEIIVPEGSIMNNFKLDAE